MWACTCSFTRLPLPGVLMGVQEAHSLYRGFSHLLASFSQDPDRASAGRDPERVPPALGGECPPTQFCSRAGQLLRRLGPTPSLAGPHSTRVGHLSTVGSYFIGSFTPSLVPQTGHKGQGWWVNRPVSCWWPWVAVLTTESPRER